MQVLLQVRIVLWAKIFKNQFRVFILIEQHLTIVRGMIFQYPFNTEMFPIIFMIPITGTTVFMVTHFMIDHSVPVSTPLCTNNKELC